ncbi:MAG: hypothetical protein AB7K86_13390 [Rhodospirillales bacterium]
MGLSAPAIVPYALARLPARACVDGEWRVRHLVIDPARPGPLRLNGGLLDFRDAPAAETLHDAAAQIDYVCGVLKSYCDTWQRDATLFLDCYFAFVAAQIASHRDALADRLAPFGAMYDVRHWAFSAWQPIPQAHLDPAGAGRLEDMVRFDFAFWSGEAFVAVDVVGDGMASGRRRAAIERLTAQGHRVLAVAAADLQGGADVFEAGFPDGFRRFWEGQRTPSGPFKPRGLVPPRPAEA